MECKEIKCACCGEVANITFETDRDVEAVLGMAGWKHVGDDYFCPDCKPGKQVVEGWIARKQNGGLMFWSTDAFDPVIHLPGDYSIGNGLEVGNKPLKVKITLERI